MAFPLGKAVKLVTRLGVELMSLSLARRRAVRGFRSGLEEMGVPPRVVAELVAQFPRFEMGTTGLVPPLGPSGGRVAPLGPGGVVGRKGRTGRRSERGRHVRGDPASRRWPRR